MIKAKGISEKAEEMEIKSYKDLFVWQKAMELVTAVYAITKDFPKEEQYGLTAQIRRSAISVPSNIAEGYGENQPSTIFDFCKLPSGRFMNCKHNWK